MNQELLLQAADLWKSMIKTATGVEEDVQNELNLSSGALETDFAEVEKELDLHLPLEMKALYAIHNGQTWVNNVKPFIENLMLMDTKAIIEQWQFLNDEFEGDGMELEADAKIKPMLWNPKWIPIADNGGGDYVCLDTDPSDDGTVGQVLYFYHDWGNRSVTANSLFGFLETCMIEK